MHNYMNQQHTVPTHDQTDLCTDTGHKARPYARCHYALGNLAHYDAAAVLDAGGLALIVKAPVLH